MKGKPQLLKLVKSTKTIVTSKPETTKDATKPAGSPTSGAK